MKVIKNNLEPNAEVKSRPYPREHVCEKCQSELEYDESDVYVGQMGYAYIKCPICGEENLLEDNEYAIKLSSENIEFPKHFHHTSKNTGAIDISSIAIQKWIQEGINDFRRRPKEKYDYSCQCGDTFLHIYRDNYDEEYDIVVSKDYYQTTIPFEEEDYTNYQ